MFGVFVAVNSECNPSANRFVEKWFHDCVYTTWELVAFWIGMSSVMFWIVAQLPQYVSNVRNQSAEALSPWFLFQWLTGDSLNLLGCLLTGSQLATETITASYFIFADFMIISQYIYYNMRTKEKLALEEQDGRSGFLKHKHIGEFRDPSKEAFSDLQKRLSKITVVNPDISNDLELDDETQRKGHQQYHPVIFAAGRSGASMIAHAVQSPRSPHVDHPEKSSHTGTSITIPPSPGEGRSRESQFQESPRALSQPSALSKGPIRALQDQEHGRARQFQSVEERNLSLDQRRRSAALRGKIPDVHVQQLFPTANAMKRHFRRLVNEYDLESGLPLASRLTIHHATSSGERHLEKLTGSKKTSRLGSRLEKRPVKAAACLSSLLAVGTSTNCFQKSEIPGPSQGLAVGSRRLLVDKRQPGPAFSLGRGSSPARFARKLLHIWGEGQRPWWVKRFGDCLGWISSGFYLGSRLAQIARNFQRRSAEGLSLAMISCAILANISMGVSILMRANSWDELADKAPWILGSLGTVSLDVFIICQAKYLDARSKAQAVPDERTPLLP